MDNWGMVFANLKQMVQKESVERIEWYKRNKEAQQENHDKETPETLYTYATYQRRFLKQLLKRAFEFTQENPNMEKNMCWYSY